MKFWQLLTIFFIYATADDMSFIGDDDVLPVATKEHEVGTVKCCD